MEKRTPINLQIPTAEVEAKANELLNVINAWGVQGAAQVLIVNVTLEHLLKHHGIEVDGVSVHEVKVVKKEESKLIAPPKGFRA